MAAKKSSGGRKYGKAAGKKVKRAMHERKHGTLKSGSGRKVKSRKQAIAIGLSEARESGAKVPKKRSSAKKGGARKKSSSKKSSSKKSTRKRSTKKSSSKRSSSKKSTRKRSSSKRS